MYPFSCAFGLRFSAACAGEGRILFSEVKRLEKRMSREDCLALLQERYRALLAAGDDRYPRRSDFSEHEVVAIKAFLGPWPRALEAAGLKPPRDGDRIQKNREKRIRAKRERRLQKNETEEQGDS